MERAGDRLERLLVQTDPFEGQDCGRQDCVLCRIPENRKSCNRRNLVYRATCTLCEDQRKADLEEAAERGEEEGFVSRRKVAEYIGESGRSIYRRGKEHLELWSREEETSFMMKHLVQHHSSRPKEDLRFRFEVIKFFRTAFERQIF